MIGLILLALVGSQTGHASRPLLAEAEQHDRQVGSAEKAIEILKKIEASALRSYPELKASEQRFEQAREYEFSARGKFYDPKLKSSFTTIPFGQYPASWTDIVLQQNTPLLGARLVGGYRLGQGEFAAYDGKLLTARWGEVRGGIELPLLRGSWIDPLRAAIEIAERDYESAEAGLTLEQARTLLTARESFYRWSVAGLILQIQRDLLSLAKVREKQLQEAVRLGDSPQIDVIDNQRAIVKRQGDLLSADRALQKAAFELSLVYRNDLGEPILLPASELPPLLPEPVALEPSAIEKDAERAREEHPEVTQYALKKARAEIESSATWNQLFPRLDVFTHAAKDFGSGTSEIETPELRVGVTLEFPIPNREAWGASRAAQAKVRETELDLSFTRDKVTTKIRDTGQAVNVARERFLLASQEVEMARKLEKAERIRFKAGTSNLFIVNLREQSTADARIREAGALETYFRARATYDYLATRFRRSPR